MLLFFLIFFPFLLLLFVMFSVTSHQTTSVHVLHSLSDQVLLSVFYVFFYIYEDMFRQLEYLKNINISNCIVFLIRLLCPMIFRNSATWLQREIIHRFSYRDDMPVMLARAVFRLFLLHPGAVA